MKEQLILALMPVVEKFAGEMIGKLGNVDKIKKDLISDQRKHQDLVEQKERELADIKKQKVLGKEDFDKRITALENSKEDFITKTKSYEELRNDLKSKEKDIDSKLMESDIELIRAKDVRVQADKLKEDAKSEKETYELKIRSLHSDTDRLDKKQKEQDDRDKQLKSRENDIYLKETKNNDKAVELNDLGLRLKVERKEVDRLKNRYTLKKELGEKQ